MSIRNRSLLAGALLVICLGAPASASHRGADVESEDPLPPGETTADPEPQLPPVPWVEAEIPYLQLLVQTDPVQAVARAQVALRVAENGRAAEKAQAGRLRSVCEDVSRRALAQQAPRGSDADALPRIALVTHFVECLPADDPARTSLAEEKLRLAGSYRSHADTAAARGAKSAEALFRAAAKALLSTVAPEEAGSSTTDLRIDTRGAACEDFTRRLRRALSGTGAADGRAEIAWTRCSSTSRTEERNASYTDKVRVRDGNEEKHVQVCPPDGTKQWNPDSMSYTSDCFTKTVYEQKYKEEWVTKERRESVLTAAVAYEGALTLRAEGREESVRLAYSDDVTSTSWDMPEAHPFERTGLDLERAAEDAIVKQISAAWRRLRGALADARLAKAGTDPLMREDAWAYFLQLHFKLPDEAADELKRTWGWSRKQVDDVFEGKLLPEGPWPTIDPRQFSSPEVAPSPTPRVDAGESFFQRRRADRGEGANRMFSLLGTRTTPKGSALPPRDSLVLRWESWGLKPREELEGILGVALDLGTTNGGLLIGAAGEAAVSVHDRGLMMALVLRAGIGGTVAGTVKNDPYLDAFAPFARGELRLWYNAAVRHSFELDAGASARAGETLAWIRSVALRYHLVVSGEATLDSFSHSWRVLDLGVFVDDSSLVRSVGVLVGIH